MRTLTILGVWCVLAAPMLADQNGVCTLEDKKYTAEYQCPDGYEVSISGEGTKTCTGACHKKSDSGSFEKAMKFHAEARDATLQMNSSALQRAFQQSSGGRVVEVETTRGKLEVCIPEKGKCSGGRSEWQKRFKY